MNKNGLKPIALFEAIKGLLALLVSIGSHELVGENIRLIAENLVAHLHLNPASHLPSVFIKFSGEFDSGKLAILAIGSLVYSVVRFIEAYGLWHGYRWTEWFAFISGAIYLPFEIYEFIVNTSYLSVILLVINSAIVLYLYSVLKKQKNHH